MQFCVTSYNRQTARFISSLEDTLITFRRIAAGNLSAPLTPAPDTPCASSSTANMQVLSVLAVHVQECKYWRSGGTPQYLSRNTEGRMAGGPRVSTLISSFYCPVYLLYWYKVQILTLSNTQGRMAGGMRVSPLISSSPRPAGTQFTFFTRTKVQILTCLASHLLFSGGSHVAGVWGVVYAGTEFTWFTGTKVQILKQRLFEAVVCARGAEAAQVSEKRFRGQANARLV